MAVYRRRLCADCGTEVRDTTIIKAPPPCAACGGATRYPSARWYVSVSVRAPTGTRRLTRAVSARKSVAQAEERRLVGEREQGAVVRRAEQVSFARAAQAFRTWLDARERGGKLAAGSAQSYRCRLGAHLEPHFAGDLQSIDFEAADTYAAMRQRAGVQPATINRELATLKRLLSVAVSKRLITANPMDGYELLEEDNARDRHLSAAEVETLLDTCSEEGRAPHLYYIVLLALHTGLRRDGCLSLRWEEIDWPRGEVTKVVKGKTVVHVPMTGALRRELLEWRARGGVLRATGLVFPSPKTGKQLRGQFGFERAVKRARLDGLHFHDLRHTFATLFLEQFPDQIETLRTILGHSSTHMTRRYAHITDRTRHTAMAQLEIGG